MNISKNPLPFLRFSPIRKTFLLNVEFLVWSSWCGVLGARDAFRCCDNDKSGIGRSIYCNFMKHPMEQDGFWARTGEEDEDATIGIETDGSAQQY